MGGISAATHLSIAWLTPVSIGLPLLNYEVQLVDFSSDITETIVLNRTLPRTYTRLGLSPGRNYSFAVAARNRIGWSEYVAHSHISAAWHPLPTLTPWATQLMSAYTLARDLASRAVSHPFRSVRLTSSAPYASGILPPSSYRLHLARRPTR